MQQNCPYLEVDGKDLSSYHFYKKVNGEIPAYLRILPAGVSYKEVSLGRVIVKKEYRGQGLAQELLRRGIEFTLIELKENTRDSTTWRSFMDHSASRQYRMCIWKTAFRMSICCCKKPKLYKKK